MIVISIENITVGYLLNYTDKITHFHTIMSREHIFKNIYYFQNAAYWKLSMVFQSK